MLVNPVFSARRRRSIPAIRALLEASGIQVQLEDTGIDGATARLARRAAEAYDAAETSSIASQSNDPGQSSAVAQATGRTDAIFVCGGDGTVFDVLQGAAGSSIPIGILPFGTGNVLVQNLNLPRSPLAAARALLDATPIPVPLGSIQHGSQSWYFAMSAGTGGHAAMMRAAYRYHKHRTGRLAYFAAGFEILATHPLQTFGLSLTTVTGETRTRQASELIALRVPQLNLWRTGGSLTRPVLRVASVAGASRLRLARAAFDSLALASGERGHSDPATAAAIYEDAVSLTITPAPGSPPLPLQADGEIITTITAAQPVTIAITDTHVTLLANRTRLP